MTEKEKKLNYNSDITYLTNTEFGFDYLRDNLAISTNQIVQRPYYGIIDEVDSILIDEARTPLLIWKIRCLFVRQIYSSSGSCML